MKSGLRNINRKIASHLELILDTSVTLLYSSRFIQSHCFVLIMARKRSQKTINFNISWQLVELVSVAHLQTVAEAGRAFDIYSAWSDTISNYISGPSGDFKWTLLIWKTEAYLCGLVITRLLKETYWNICPSNCSVLFLFFSLSTQLVFDVLTGRMFPSTSQSVYPATFHFPSVLHRT